MKPWLFRGCAVALGLLALLLAVAGYQAWAFLNPLSEHQLEVAGETRSYALFVPPDHNPDTGKLPLVIALHAFMDSAEGMRRLTGLDAVAGRERFLVAYPNGRWRHWRVQARQQAGVEEDIRFIDGLIARLVETRGADPHRVYLTGASNGAMMAHLLACAIPGKVAAIAPCYGTLTRAAAERAETPLPMPVLMMHGTDDPIVRWGGGDDTWYGQPGYDSVEKTVAFWVERNGCETASKTAALPDTAPEDGAIAREIRHRQCLAGAEVILIRIEGGGHTWPGSDFNPAGETVGTVCQDFNASQRIWRFFQAHRR